MTLPPNYDKDKTYPVFLLTDGTNPFYRVMHLIQERDKLLDFITDNLMPYLGENYKGHDTTLEGLAKLNDRLESHNANVTYKLYESHHYQFIPEMLSEFLKETYPKQ